MENILELSQLVVKVGYWRDKKLTGSGDEVCKMGVENIWSEMKEWHYGKH